MKNTGLIPTRRDIRNFNHEVQFGAANLSELPKTGLGRKPLSIKDQKQTYWCTGFGSATASEYIEGIVMSPEFQIAKIGEIMGGPVKTGATVAAMMKALRLFGSLPQKDAPFSLEKDGETIADWTLWPRELNQKSDDYLKASSYDVMRGSYDTFDNIRSALWKAKQDGEERVAIVASQWFENWTGNGIMRRGIGAFYWHCWLIIDWTEVNGEPVLIAQNSYGKNWGNDGLAYFSREAINQLAEHPMNDVQMVRDLTPETAKEAQWNLAVTIYDMLVKIDPTKAVKWLVEFVRDILTSNSPALPPKSLQDAPKPPAPTPHTTPADLPLIQALIQVESGGDDFAVGDKHLKHKAYGCLQIRKPCVDDVNLATGEAYTAEMMRGNRELSIKIFREYMKLYATEKLIGRPVTDQDRARIWNGGPTGYKRASTLPYWNKVKKHL